MKKILCMVVSLSLILVGLSMAFYGNRARPMDELQEIINKDGHEEIEGIKTVEVPVKGLYETNRTYVLIAGSSSDRTMCGIVMLDELNQGVESGAIVRYYHDSKTYVWMDWNSGEPEPLSQGKAWTLIQEWIDLYKAVTTPSSVPI